MSEYMSFGPTSFSVPKWDLGCRIGDRYRLAPDADETITTIVRTLESKNNQLEFRRSLSFSRIASRDLAPILYASGSVVTSSKNESTEDIKQQLPIFTNVIR